MLMTCIDMQALIGVWPSSYNCSTQRYVYYCCKGHDTCYKYVAHLTQTDFYNYKMQIINQRVVTSPSTTYIVIDPRKRP